MFQQPIPRLGNGAFGRTTATSKSQSTHLDATMAHCTETSTRAELEPEKRTRRIKRPAFLTPARTTEHVAHQRPNPETRPTRTEALHATRPPHLDLLSTSQSTIAPAPDSIRSIAVSSSTERLF
ncbi:hypothetical protein NPIL_691731 [Nephila pilipes]|uniref:Uncharacterized protein n=1 Tax=Nephila pilipes TaxID=299642 RepID=A0A8X6NQQ7_NEPPI|nr:hypothetical protein NPIL_691731 [Nephila pilipes]